MENTKVTRNILRGSVIIFVVAILAKLTAFLTEAILAAYLGANEQSDAYYMVSSIQMVLYPMLSVGIWKVFLPVYKEKITLGHVRDAEKFTNQGITFFTLASIAAVILLEIFASPVVSLVAPGFEGEKRRLCIELVRISAPMYILILAAAIYAALLQCHNRFFGSQIREVASHIPTILAALLLYHRFGIRVFAVALIVGGLLRLLIELPFVNWGYRFKPDLNFRSKEFKLMLRRLPSALLSEGVIQLNHMIDKMMASTLPDGTISCLNYGSRLTSVFTGLVSTSVSTALYPQMIELISKKNQEALNRLITRILSIFSVMMLPISLGCVLYRNELVSVAFQRGSFNASNVALTAGIFSLYAVGLFFTASNGIVTNVFYGHGDTKTPLLFSLANMLINVGLNLLLIHKLGANGLALATSLSAILSFGIRVIAARKYITLDYRKLLLTVGKVLLTAAVVILPVRWCLSQLAIPKLVTLILGAGVSIPLYLVLLRLLKVTELSDLSKLVLGRFRKSKNKNTTDSGGN